MNYLISCQNKKKIFFLEKTQSPTHNNYIIIVKFPKFYEISSRFHVDFKNKNAYVQKFWKFICPRFLYLETFQRKVKFSKNFLYLGAPS